MTECYVTYVTFADERLRGPSNNAIFDVRNDAANNEYGWECNGTAASWSPRCGWYQSENKGEG